MFLISVFFLSAYVFGNSSVGTISNFLTIEDAFAKNAWCAGLTICYFILPAIVEFAVYYDQIEFKKFFMIKNYLKLMIILILFNFWGYGLIYASTRTIQSHAYVLNNFHSFFVFLINWSQGEAMIKREYIGLAIVALGCLVMMMD